MSTRIASVCALVGMALEALKEALVASDHGSTGLSVLAVAATCYWLFHAVRLVAGDRV